MTFMKALEGVLVAGLGGAVTTVAQYITDPGHFELKHTGPMALAGAVTGIAAWIRQSPTTPASPPKP